MGTAYYSGARYTNPFVDALVDGWRWTSGDTIAFYLDGTGARSGDVPASWQSMGAGSAIQAAAAAWNAVANIHYQITDSRGSADYVESLYSDTSVNDDGTVELGEHSYPGSDPAYGKYNTGSGYFTAEDLTRGGLMYETFIHELGHGLGLDHPFDGAQVFPGVTQGDSSSTGDNDLNSQLYTVMTYNDVSITSGNSGHADYGNAETPMALDIAAVQALYGANMTTATGNDTYVLPHANGAGTGYVCIWDAGGIDTISAAGLTGSCTIDLRAATLQDAYGGGGYLSRETGIYGGFTIANGVTIENAIGGSGKDYLTGNGAANILDGGGGDDVLLGGAGADTFVLYKDSTESIGDFKGGYDKVDVSRLGAVSAKATGSAVVTTVFYDASGHDVGTVQDPLFQASDLPGIGISYDISFKTGNISLVAGDGADKLSVYSDSHISGEGGADILHGSGDDDILSGGAGNDQITIATLGTGDVLNGDDGDDQLIVTDEATADPGAAGVTLHGGAGDDAITGGRSRDLLDGGSGADTMQGGLGDDTYVVDNGHDKVSEAAGAGTDTIEASVGWRLEDNVENLTLTGAATVGKGNALANVMTANDLGDTFYAFDGNDALVGGKGADHLDGGSGADTMQGGAGNDTYMVDNAHDVVTESANAGTDTIETSVSWRLESNVENLMLTGTADLVGKGNGLDNHLVGNTGADSLYGFDGDDVIQGGLGRDLLSGGSGHNSFVFTSVADFASASGSKADEIIDWGTGDRIDLSAIDAKAGGKDDAFTWIGQSSFDHHAGELQLFIKAGTTYVFGDVDGDGKADFGLKLDGVHNLTAADFVL